MKAPSDLPRHWLPLPSGDVNYTEAGVGVPVLLIHGSLCDYRYWRWQIPALSSDWRVVAPSLSGCWPQAGIHPQSAYAVGAHAREMSHLVRALGVPGLHVVGHSRGAQVALEFAAHAPDLCLSLTLADPGFRFEDEPAAPVFYASAVYRLQTGDTEGAVREFVDGVNGEGTWAKMVGWFKDMVRDNAATLLSQIHEANCAVTMDTIRRIACPALLVGGANSPGKYVSRQDRLQGLLPQSSRVKIALASHGMNLANPKAFNRALLDFLAAV